MKIDSLMAGNVYKVNMKKTAEKDNGFKQVVESAGAKEAPKDTIVISADAAKHTAIDKASRVAMKDIDRPVSPEKIQILKEAIAQGKYYVPAQEIAESILFNM